MEGENSLIKLINESPVKENLLDDAYNSHIHDDDAGDQPISLGVRQPSFSSLSNVLIAKGQDTPVNLAALEETEGDAVVVITKPESAKVFQTNVEEEPANQEPAKVFQADVNEEQAKPETQVSPMVRQLSEANAARWEQMGYHPESPPQENNYIEEEPVKPKKRKDELYIASGGSLFTSNSNFKVEMPEDNDNNEDSIPEEILSNGYEESGNEYSSNYDEHNTDYNTTPENDYEDYTQNYGAHADDYEDYTHDDEHQYSYKDHEHDSDEQNAQNKNNYSKPTKKAKKGGKARKESDSNALPEDFRLNLTELKEEQAYDSEQGSSRIPERIKEIVEKEGIKKTSVTYLALCQQSIIGYEKKFNGAMNRLERLLNSTIQAGYIQESQYISDVIQRNKDEKKMFEACTRELDNDLDDQLMKAKQEKEDYCKKVNIKKMTMEQEKNMKIQEINDAYADKLDLINDEWSSDLKKREYSRPSGKLINKRYQAKFLLKQKRFKESAMLSEEARKLEEKETAEASKKFDNDYRMCLKKMNDKMAVDINTVEQWNQKKLNDFERKNIIEMRKYDNKIRSLEERNKSKTTMTRSIKSRSAVRRSETDTIKKIPDIAFQNQPLKLPELKLRNTRPQTSLCQTRRGRKDRFAKTSPF